MTNHLRKNILDLMYTTHLQYKVTAIIIALTYLIAITIAWITNQFDIHNYRQMIFIMSVSGIIITPNIHVMLNSHKQLRRIITLLQGLSQEKPTENT